MNCSRCLALGARCTEDTRMITDRDDEDSAAFQKEEELRDEMRAEEAEYRQQVRDYRDAHVGRY